jgi:hypothetical protein
VQIAGWTSQSEIGLDGQSAVLARDDMVDREKQIGLSFRKSAILTGPARPMADQ